MTQTIATIDMITRESQLVLHEALSFIPTINRSFDDSFGKVGAKIGDVLRVRLPARTTVRTGRAMNVQDQTDESVSLTVATQKGVDLGFTSAEMALGIDYISERYITPAIKNLVSQVEADVIGGVTKYVSNVAGSAGTAMTDLSALGTARAYLNGQGAPMSDRSIMLDSVQMASLVNGMKAQFFDPEAGKKAQREGYYGRMAMGDLYENEKLWTMTNAGDVATNLNAYTITNGDADITVDALSTASTQGMVFTIAGVYACHPETKANLGYLKQWVDAGGSSTTNIVVQGGIYISGPKQNCVATGVSTTAAIVFVGTATGAYRQGIMYNKDAFAFVTADLPLVGGADRCARMTQDGISVRVWQDGDIRNDQLLTRIDILYGYQCIRPEYACRLIGAAVA
jgi:hypothetical protein